MQDRGSPDSALPRDSWRASRFAPETGTQVEISAIAAEKWQEFRLACLFVLPAEFVTWENLIASRLWARFSGTQVEIFAILSWKWQKLRLVCLCQVQSGLYSTASSMAFMLSSTNCGLTHV